VTRIALVGEGPLPGPESTETRFASLRLAWFHAALQSHTVELFDSTQPIDRAARARAARCDVVVSAGVYGPTRAALALTDDQPLWVDLPGDPFADAQAVGALTDPEVVAREAAAVFLPALARGDAFSTISRRSRWSLLGQLGALGRLARTPLGEEWAWVVPSRWAFGGLPEGPPRRPGPQVRVLLAGSFNTWFDADTALAGLLRAMDAGEVVVEVTGGPVPGHHVDDHHRFREAALASRHAGRFHFHSWVDEPTLARIVARCHVLLCLDRPGFEPELGSRTRVLFALHQGLGVVATPTSELVEELAAGGYVQPVPRGDPAAVAAALLTPGTLPDRGPLRERYGAGVTDPLVRWVAAPERRRPAPEAGPLLELVRHRDALARELARLHESPAFRLLDRLGRAARPRREEPPE